MSISLPKLWAKVRRRIMRRQRGNVGADNAEDRSDVDDQALAQALSLLDAAESEQYRALAELIRTRPSQFLYELIPFKEALTKRMSPSEAIGVFRGLLQLPSNSTAEHLPIKSSFDAASEHARTFRETAPSGAAFVAEPPRVVGAGDPRPLHCVTRSLYVACLPEAVVHGRSAVIKFRDTALLDFQGREFDQVDEQLVLDLPVLQASKQHLWLATSRADGLKLDEAFNLLGPNSPQFGHWIWEYLPKYISAATSAQLANVPVLIDAHMPPTHREFLQMLLPPTVEIVEVPYNGTVHVKRLWCAPNLSYIPIYLKTLDSMWPTYEVPPPDRFAAVFREIMRRTNSALGSEGGSERIYLARKPHQLKKLVNYETIEQQAKQQGFQVIYPQDISFADQLRLVRGARFIVGPEGSAILLGFLARPGTRLCILSSTHMFNAASYTCLLDEIGVDVTIFTGEVTNENETYAHFADYKIPEDRFQQFLKGWLS